MHPEIARLGQTFTRFIEARIAMQWQALRDEWEPKLVERLTGLADDCLAELKAALAQAEALAGLEADANWWRVRLKAVAVTVLHGVFNRTQRAVLDA